MKSGDTAPITRLGDSLRRKGGLALARPEKGDRIWDGLSEFTAP